MLASLACGCVHPCAEATRPAMPCTLGEPYHTGAHEDLPLFQVEGAMTPMEDPEKQGGIGIGPSGMAAARCGGPLANQPCDAWEKVFRCKFQP